MLPLGHIVILRHGKASSDMSLQFTACPIALRR